MFVGVALKPGREERERLNIEAIFPVVRGRELSEVVGDGPL